MPGHLLPLCLWLLISPSIATSPDLSFSFDAGFGSNMVLQRAPAAAAVYGFVGPFASPLIVSVSITDEERNHTLAIPAAINSTQQPYGPEWGVRPCSATACPPDAMGPFTPWNGPVATWKALLPPMPAGGNYTVTVSCQGCTSTAHGEPARIAITNVTFGDVWYCTGQSNMWLPVAHTFSRNDTAQNITAGRYNNVRVMAGNSGNAPWAAWPPAYGAVGGSNPWLTAEQAAPAGCVEKQTCALFQVGGTCWYFAQELAERGVSVPIGILDTAIGGQRIEEFMDNSTIGVCSDRLGENIPWWDGQLFGQQVMPFVDMTVKGWVWYQGENNMGGVKGNAAANVGYGCMLRELVRGYRARWSRVPGTTDPTAPFGVVTLASSGSEGGPHMGTMRWAQTANYGVLPSPELPNTFLAQAYDLDDPWGPEGGPCFSQTWTPLGNWDCCPGSYNATICAGREALCAPACAANVDTVAVMGGIHPRNKQPVGERLAVAAYNTVYGGTAAFTGPTLAGCEVSGSTLVVEFNTTLLRGDVLKLQRIPPYVPQHGRNGGNTGGSQLWVQTNASLFCMEPQCVVNTTSGQCTNYEFCPPWAGGNPSDAPLKSGLLDSGWVQLFNITLAPSGTAILVDLTPLGGRAVPTAVRYAWGIVDCCDYTDSTVMVTHACEAACPIMSSSGLPANPFQAAIVDGACKCVAPQVC